MLDRRRAAALGRIAGSEPGVSEPLELVVLPGALEICRLPAGSEVAMPPEADFWSCTRTLDEVSVVCRPAHVPEGADREGPWRALRVAGRLDFELVGVLSALCEPLARAGISVFATSTFDTDYLLVRAESLEGAIAALRGEGLRIASA
jgi:hypothetical protein